MIKMINDTEKALIFAHEFAQDLVFSHPMLSGEAQFYKNLAKAVGQPEKYRVIGIYQEETLTGLFSFLVIPEEKYLEMTAGLSRTKEDYEEVMDYLKKSFPGYKADFVYNPRNLLMDKMVRTNGARMETDMQEKMILSKIVPVTTDLTVIPYSVTTGKATAGFTTMTADGIGQRKRPSRQKKSFRFFWRWRAKRLSAIST